MAAHFSDSSNPVSRTVATAPSREQLDRVVAALADIGRPVTRGELLAYGRRLRSMRSGELLELLTALESRGVVRSFDRDEPRATGAAFIVRRRYFEVVGNGGNH